MLPEQSSIAVVDKYASFESSTGCLGIDSLIWRSFFRVHLGLGRRYLLDGDVDLCGIPPLTAQNAVKDGAPSFVVGMEETEPRPVQSPQSNLQTRCAADEANSAGCAVWWIVTATIAFSVGLL